MLKWQQNNSEAEKYKADEEENHVCCYDTNTKQKTEKKTKSVNIREKRVQNFDFKFIERQIY